MSGMSKALKVLHKTCPTTNDTVYLTRVTVDVAAHKFASVEIAKAEKSG